ncbi:rhamnogalacturonan acetylesterase [Christiangramia crocea]|uniref:Rhamnogalacturonan acetylesterase n=1 Tax=Christiangramia crocea TaxID=2904124 RepID=A0A9X1UTH7_9FLAO|nr:rhamnogalacturonan acetylesterase [Gramella crocea]MCG9970027.1 rhamnogalacturonan acetylesterase [Gramella crocea]
MIDQNQALFDWIKYNPLKTRIIFISKAGLKLIFVFIILHCNEVLAQSSKVLKFTFGKSPDSSAILIDYPVEFQSEKAYGFDFGTSQKVEIGPTGFTSKAPVYFSTKVPEGNYKIEIILGLDKKASETTIKAESKRIFYDRIPVKKGGQRSESFIVNVRKPEMKDGGTASLKNRELDDLDWDDKLTLEFSGDVAVQKICITPLNDFKTLYLAGDSTMTDQDLEPWASWGQAVTQYFNKEIAIANHAFSGASLASFKGRKRLEKIEEQIKPGDYLVIGFAHNDEKRKGEGIGPWQSYTDLLKEFILTARSKGAEPILITPAQRRLFKKDGKLIPTHGDYPAAIRKVARDMNVPLIDLTKMTTKMYEAWGVEESKKAFVQYPAHTFPGQDKKLEDNTHFNNFGANEIALAFIQGLREQNSSLSEYLKKETPGYDPEKPNELSSWKVPLSPRFENTKPDGN